MVNETTRKMMTGQLAELREKEKAATGLAEYFQNQILKREYSLSQLGIPIPDHNDNHPRNPEGETPRTTGEETASREAGNQEAENQEAENQEAENREVENQEVENRTATATPEPNGTKTNYAHVPGHRMQQLRYMNGDDMTGAELRELELMEQLQACPNQSSMMRTIAARTGDRSQESYRIQISSAAIHIIGAGLTKMVDARNLGNHLRYSILSKDADHWIVASNKNDAQFFPEGKPVTDDSPPVEPRDNHQPPHNGMMNL